MLTPEEIAKLTAIEGRTMAEIGGEFEREMDALARIEGRPRVSLDSVRRRRPSRSELEQEWRLPCEPRPFAKEVER